LIEIGDLMDVRLFSRQYDSVIRQYPDLGERRLVHEIVRRMINYIVTDFIQTTQANLDAARPQTMDDVRAQSKPLAALSETGHDEHVELMMFLREHVYRHYKVLRMTSKARRVLKGLFEALFADVNLMPAEHRDIALAYEKERGIEGKARAVADYIAGMTDRFAILEHSRLYDATERT